jgi:hypothetical protein
MILYEYFILSISLCQYIFDIFLEFSEKMAHNVPAVYDVLPARIEKCVAFLGLAKCAGATAWE